MNHIDPEAPDFDDLDDQDVLSGTDAMDTVAQGQLLQNTNPPKIRVVVRTRPMNAKEVEKGDENIVTVDSNDGVLNVDEPKQKVDLTKYIDRHKFVFDDSLDHSVSNDIVYSYTVQPLVQTIFKNGKATCFAYGQTGSGKTYTMSPLPPRAASEIISLLKTHYTDLGLFVSCFEIYGNRVFDLLNARKALPVREDAKKKVNVVGLQEFHVTDDSVVQDLIDHAAAARQTGQTGANAESSRSHSIMQFSLKRIQPTGETREVGRLSFIDLAGSERGADTFNNDKQTRLEGAEINKSLLALKECIRALDGDALHVPFRGSKLTEVLRDSFVGEQARTVMIANISPSSSSVEHTLNTLRYADRVKELRKDKRQRSSGSVTPGVGNKTYNIAAQRGGSTLQKPAPPSVSPPTTAPSRTQGSSSSSSSSFNPARQPFVPRTINTIAEEEAAPVPAPAREPPHRYATDSPGSNAENEQMMNARQELMDLILEEEDELIQSHRKEIEVTMTAVRAEMNLLSQVDQPGSAITHYVKNLREVLSNKATAIETLMTKLDSFDAKLQQEEMLNTAIGQRAK